MKNSTLLVLLLLAFCFSSQAQVLNAGFETWSGGNPTSWWTGNIPGIMTTVTQSATAHGGTSALRGDVISFGGNAVPPAAQSGISGMGHTVSQRYATLTGYYQFGPTSGDRFSVNVAMYKGGNGIGIGAISTSVAAASYTLFTVTIAYSTQEIPDTCIVQLTIIGPTTNNNFHVGSWMLVDDLLLSGTATSAGSGMSQTPERFSLMQNYPNPFNPSTEIIYGVPEMASVRITVVDVLGREVSTLADGPAGAGSHTVSWNGLDASGQRVGSGVYFCLIRALGQTGKEFSQTRKMVLVR